MSWEPPRPTGGGIVITPSPIELGLHEAAYIELVDALRDQGLKARLEPPIERRGGTPVEIAADVAVQILGVAEDHIIELVVTALLAKLGIRRHRARKGTPRRVVIYGRSGEVLREVDVPSAPDDEGPG